MREKARLLVETRYVICLDIDLPVIAGSSTLT